MTIIPAIDIINGCAVRLSGGDFNQKKVYSDDCLYLAKSFEDAGLRRLHLVDLDGAKNKKITNLNVLERLATATSLIIDFGGGVTSLQDVKSIFDAGASQCTIGSMAAKEPEVFGSWVEQFGSEKFLVGADVADEKIRISGWLEEGGISLFDFLEKMQSFGLNEFFCTDIAKDGMLMGPSVELYKKILHQFPETNLIASGGVSSLSDLYKLKEAGCSGAIVGKAIYENKISLKELSEFINHVS